MQRFPCWTLILLAVFATAAPVFAADPADIAPFPMTSARNYSLGGPHTAYTRDITALAINPAALKTINKQFHIAEIGIGTHGRVGALIPIISAAMSGSFDEFDSSTIGGLTSNSDGKIPLGFEMRGPLSIGYMNQGYGFGLYDRIYLDTQFIGTTLRLNTNADILLNGGYAYRILDKEPHALDIGVGAKVFLRYTFGVNGSVLDMVNDAGTLAEDSPLGLIAGGGFDLGVLYHVGEQLSFGLTCNDVFAMGFINYLGKSNDSSNIGFIKPQVNFGTAYTFPAWKHVTLSLMLDYRDLVNIFTNDYTTRNPILNLGFGAEAQIIRFIYARIGVNDMLPAVGIGFDIKVFKINAAIYGKELSNEPGGLSTHALDISFIFSK
jgi:hypothetical protein